MGAEGYQHGGAWGICPRCSAKKRLRTFRKEHTGWRVCPECWDPKSPQELVRGRPDRQTVPNPAPEPADYFGTAEEITPEAYSLFLRMTAQPVAARQTLINALVVSLQNAGVWPKLEALHIFAAHDAQAARCNWIADTFSLTEVNSPTFTADRGYAGNGTSSYLRGVPVSGWGRFTQNSASMLVWSRTNAADVTTQTEIGLSTGVITTFVRVRNAFDTLVTRANDGTSTPCAVTTGLGLFGFSRRSSTAYDQIVAGAVLASPAVTTTAAPVGDLNICGLVGNAFSARSVAASVIGEGLTAGEITALNTALTTYLTAVGAV